MYVYSRFINAIDLLCQYNSASAIGLLRQYNSVSVVGLFC